jgi:hypothetical protein
MSRIPHLPCSQTHSLFPIISHGPHDSSREEEISTSDYRLERRAKDISTPKALIAPQSTPFLHSKPTWQTIKQIWEDYNPHSVQTPTKTKIPKTLITGDDFPKHDRIKSINVLQPVGSIGGTKKTADLGE